MLIGFLVITLLIALLTALYKLERSQKNRPRAKMEEYWNGRERRQHQRFKTSLNVTYLLKKAPHNNSNGKTVNLSEGGAQLLLDMKLAVKDLLELEILIPCSTKMRSEDSGAPQENMRARLVGEVVWSKESEEESLGKRFFHAGIRFLNMNEPHKRTLCEYIRTLPSDSAD